MIVTGQRAIDAKELWRRREEFKATVVKAVGPVSSWSFNRHNVQFRTSGPITLKAIMALSEALGTDEINFDFGNSGEHGYSEVTPGCDGSPGCIEVKWPPSEKRKT